MQAISMCGRQGLWKEAVFLLRDAQAAPRARRGVDVVTYSAAIAACRNGGEWKQALSLMEVTGTGLVLCVFLIVEGGKRRTTLAADPCCDRSTFPHHIFGGTISELTGWVLNCGNCTQYRWHDIHSFNDFFFIY